MGGDMDGMRHITSSRPTVTMTGTGMSMSTDSTTPMTGMLVMALFSPQPISPASAGVLLQWK